MNKNLALVVALLALVGGGVALVVTQGGETDGMATGKVSKADQLWTRLMDVKEPYLSAWMGIYDGGDKPSPTHVLEAWNEVALQVTGPGGFWRRQVPDRWMGCSQLPDSAACGSLAAAEEAEFGRFDKITSEIHDMTPKKARRFLAQNADAMLDYIDMYVPEDMTSPAMQKTPFFTKHLAEPMRSDGML